MSLNLQQLAKSLKLEFRGDAELDIDGVASPESALAGDLCFILHRKFIGDIHASKCGVVILPAELAVEVKGKALLLSDNPQASFVEAIKVLGLEPQAPTGGSVHPSALIAASARIGSGVTIGALVVIEDDVEVGSGTSIGAGSIVEKSAFIGSQCILHSRVTLGPAVKLGDRRLFDD